MQCSTLCTSTGNRLDYIWLLMFENLTIIMVTNSIGTTQRNLNEMNSFQLIAASKIEVAHIHPQDVILHILRV